MSKEPNKKLPHPIVKTKSAMASTRDNRHHSENRSRSPVGGKVVFYIIEK